MIDLATLLSLQPPAGLSPASGMADNAIKNSGIESNTNTLAVFAPMLQQLLPESLPQTRIVAPAPPLTASLTPVTLPGASGNSLPPTVVGEEVSHGNSLPPEIKIAPVPATLLAPGLSVSPPTPPVTTVTVSAAMLSALQQQVLPAKQAPGLAIEATQAPVARAMSPAAATVTEAVAVSPRSETLPTVNGKAVVLPTEQATVLAAVVQTLAHGRSEHRERVPVIARTALGEQQPGQMLLGNLQPSVDTAFNGAKPLTSAMTLPTPVQHPDWAQGLAQRVYWIAGQQQHGASIRLDPPELGTLEVRIHMDKDQASVQFTTPHAAVREAVEAALPRLREMFAHSGIELLDAGVKEQSQDHHGSTRDLPPQARGDAVIADAETQEALSWGHLAMPRGLIDYYI